MYKLAANVAVAVSLLLSATGATPVMAGKPHDAKCTAAKHKHSKRMVGQTKAKPGPGAMLVDKRKFDVQILSFGP